MIAFKPNNEWSTYEANVQAYRSNFLSSQSLLLAVGAIVLDKNWVLIIFIAIIGLLQMWYIWYRVIITRTRIVDYHKFGMNTLFDNEGELLSSSNYLKENTYAMNKKTRDKVNKKMSEMWERKTKFTTFRTTRLKLDLFLPVSITFIWVFFIFYGLLTRA